jgi:hypothetical protein
MRSEIWCGDARRGREWRIHAVSVTDPQAGVTPLFRD